MLELRTDCPQCGAQMATEANDCAACGANRFDELQIRAIEQTAIRDARRWMLGIGLWYVVSALITIAVAPVGGPATTMLLGLSFSMFGAQVGLWYWAEWQPLRASVVALGIFLLVHLGNAWVDPSTLLSGIVLKLFCVVVLVRSIIGGLEVSQMRNKNRERRQLAVARVVNRGEPPRT
jgi:hypothetical protein